MSTIWHPHTQPPSDSRRVRLRFGDDGERDAIGFYHSGHGCYYKSLRAMYQRASVHPTHWAYQDVSIHPTHWAEIKKAKS